MEKITDINQLKMSVLKKAAEYAFDGTLEQNIDKIPYEIIPGQQPQFRCCVYREREIIRERVRLAMGLVPTNEDDGTDDAQAVHVISSACEGCPITRFTVTDNCHNCLAQKCIKACKFGAITKTPKGAFIDKTKCKKCGQCVLACPYNAIVDIERPCIRSCPVDAITMDDNDLAYIDKTKCINCGQCVISCPFGALGDISMITNVIENIRDENSKVYAMFAPSVEGQFGDIKIPVLKEAIKAIGFEDAFEVALGADAVSYNEALEVIENVKNGKQTTTSCCPAFYNLIHKHFPMLADNVSTTVSPMIATARYIKTIDENAVIVFIGPCIAKKNEAMSRYKDEIDFVLTFEELSAMFIVKNINFDDYSFAAEYDEDATKFGKYFARSGGVADSVVKVVEETGEDIEVKAIKCNGILECKKALLMMKSGRLKEDIIEGMACINGCVNGPAKVKEVSETKKIFDKNVNVPKDNITQNNIDNKLDKINMHSH